MDQRFHDRGTWYRFAYTGGGLAPGNPDFEFLLDWMATFGLTLIPLGGILLVASKNPVRNRLLVHLVIAHEAIAGILDDAWFITRDHVEDPFYIGFILVHVVVIATGVRALRRTPVAEPATAPAASVEEAAA